MDELSDLLLEVLFVLLEAVLTSEKEKSDLQNWMKQQQEEQMVAGEQTANCVWKAVS